MTTERQAAIEALQARRAARGMSDPLNRLRAHGAKAEPITAQTGPQPVATAKGYTFWRDMTGFYGVAKEGQPAPSHCGYANLEALAKLKGVTLP